MKYPYRSILVSGLVVLAVVVVGAGSWWGWILFSSQPFNVPTARSLPWPVACTIKGCVTTRAWWRHWQASQVYARTVKGEAPAPEAVLTTLLRQRLVAMAWTRGQADQREARRYREEVLNLTSEKMSQETVGLTLAEYDNDVILPLLQQEALRQQTGAGSGEELWQKLAGQHRVVVLLSSWRWDKKEAQVVND